MIKIFKSLGLFASGVLVLSAVAFVIGYFCLVFDINSLWIFFGVSGLIYALIFNGFEKKITESMKLNKWFYFLSAEVIPLLLFAILYFLGLDASESILDESAEKTLFALSATIILLISILLVFIKKGIWFISEKGHKKHGDKLNSP